MMMYMYDLSVYNCGASLLSLKNKQKMKKKKKNDTTASSQLA